MHIEEMVAAAAVSAHKQKRHAVDKRGCCRLGAAQVDVAVADAAANGPALRALRVAARREGKNWMRKISCNARGWSAHASMNLSFEGKVCGAMRHDARSN